MPNHKDLHPRRVLLAVDGSENSIVAAGMINDLHLPDECIVTAAVVVHPRQQQSTELHKSLLKEVERIFEASLFQIQTEILHGNPAEAIMDFADQHSPDLIVLGATGLRATLGILLGGVAQQVIEYSTCPVLVVRSPYLGLRNILFVTDGSSHSQVALDYLAKFSLPEITQLTVMHVLQPLPSPEQIARAWAVPVEAVEPRALEEIKRDLTRQAEEEEKEESMKLDNIVQYLEAGHKKASRALLRGDAATEIIQYVKDNDIDLVVAGSRGLSQVKGWFLGSVSRKLVHYAKSSVLIVKGPETE